jgi:hypothetical protein
MPRSRPPRAVGSYGLLDIVRQPSRLGQLPPAPDLSRRDIAALERGEARLVSCFVRNPPGIRRRGPRLGGLELSATTVSWWPFFSVRRAGRMLDIGGVTLVRPAEPSDQRFGVPGNLHLFSLVRCATPAGPLDLLVPTADLPLVTWRLSGGDIPPGEAVAWAAQATQAALAGQAAEASQARRAGRAGRRPPPSGREIRWRGLAGVVSVAIAAALIALGVGLPAALLLNTGALLIVTSIFSGFMMWRRGRRIKRTQ